MRKSFFLNKKSHIKKKTNKKKNKKNKHLNTLCPNLLNKLIPLGVCIPIAEALMTNPITEFYFFSDIHVC